MSFWVVGVSSSEVEVEQEEEEESKRSLESWKKQDSVSSSCWWSWSTVSWVMAYGAFPFGSTNPKKERGEWVLFWSESDPMNGAVRM